MSHRAIDSVPALTGIPQMTLRSSTFPNHWRRTSLDRANIKLNATKLVLFLALSSGNRNHH